MVDTGDTQDFKVVKETVFSEFERAENLFSTVCKC
jgi:hypothetical protein